MYCDVLYKKYIVIIEYELLYITWQYVFWNKYIIIYLNCLLLLMHALLDNRSIILYIDTSFC